MTPGIIAFFVVLAVITAAYALFAPAHTVIVPPSIPGDEPTMAKLSVFDRWIRPAVSNLMPQTPAALTEYARKNEGIASLLARTGNPWRVSPEEYVVVRVIAVVGGVMFLTLMMLLWATMGINLLPLWGAALIGAFLGYIAPKAMLDAAWGKRRRDLNAILPEALDLLRICMNAGYSFPNALEQTVSLLSDSITRDELTRVAAELRAGRTINQALGGFARRCPTDSVEAFVRAISQAQSTGVDIASTLAYQAGETRAEFERQIDEKSAKLQTTLFLPLIGFFLPTLLLLIFGPSVSSLMGAL